MCSRGGRQSLVPLLRRPQGGAVPLPHAACRLRPASLSFCLPPASPGQAFECGVCCLAYAWQLPSAPSSVRPAP
eukprot:8738321-Heterocapsa_arctica.AAC.1